MSAARGLGDDAVDDPHRCGVADLVDLVREGRGQLEAHQALGGEQAVITLRSFEELPYERIATVLGIHAGTARVLYHRALKKLRASLGEEAENA